MIRNQWYAILESNEVKPSRPVGVTRMGEKLVLWRDDKGQIGCMADLCPHRGVALSTGKLVGGNVQCPFHGFEYDTSGRCTLIPASGKNACATDNARFQTISVTRVAVVIAHIFCMRRIRNAGRRISRLKTPNPVTRAVACCRNERRAHAAKLSHLGI